MTEIVRQDHGPLLDLLEMIRQGRAPLGMLSTMLGHPYSFMLAQRGLGYFIAAASNDADEAADESAAAAARDGDIVADISALLVSSVLGEFDYARGRFRTLLSPTASQHDITAGRSRMDGWSASSGSVYLRPRAGYRGSPGPGHRRPLGRAGPLREAGACPLQDTAGLGPAAQLARRARDRGRGSMAGAGCAREGARAMPVERRCHPAEPRPGLRRRRLRNRHTPAAASRGALRRRGSRRSGLRRSPSRPAFRGNDGTGRAGSRRARRPGDAHRAGTPRRMERSRPCRSHSRTRCLVDPDPYSLGGPAGASRRGPGGLRPRRSMAGDSDMGRQCARAGRPRPYGRPDRVRLPYRELASRPRRSCCRHAPRWLRRGRPEESSSSCRLPGSGSNRDWRPPVSWPTRRHSSPRYARAWTRNTTKPRQVHNPDIIPAAIVASAPAKKQFRRFARMGTDRARGAVTATVSLRATPPNGPTRARIGRSRLKRPTAHLQSPTLD